MTDSQGANTQETDTQPKVPSTAAIAQADAATTSESQPGVAAVPGGATETPVPSYVKLAMRNMVKKGGKSLFHFTLTTVALLGILVGLAYVTR
jgi:hypothetical protein